MKRILTFISILPFLSACVQDPMEDMTQDNAPEFIDSESLVFDACIVSPDDQSVQNSNVRTVLGEKEGTSYPNYWTAGDAIFVNGVASEALSTASEYVGTSKARFEVKSSVDAPYYFAYPASAVSGYAAGHATVTLPENQEWLATSYDASAFLMMGTADCDYLEFKQMMSAIRLNVPKGTSNAKISSITFMSLGDEKVSGKFTIDFTNLTPLDAFPYVHVVAPKGGADFGTDVYLLIPAQKYASGMAFAIRATDGTKMTYFTKSSFTASAGKLYPLTTKAYVSDADPLMVMSSNVRYASASKKTNDPDTGDRTWENRKVAYYAMLNAMRPYVVGLQEAEKEQVVDIKQNCSGYAHIGYGRESGKDITSDFSRLEQFLGKDHGESTTILYRTDKISVQSSGWFCHSNTPGTADSYFPGTEDEQPRISTWAVMTYKETGHQFFYLNTHTTLYPAVQAKEIELILSKVADLNTSNLPVIMTGDWNLQETEALMEPVLAAYLSARQTAPFTDNYNTFHWWGTKDEKKLDHLFYKGFAACPKYCTLTQKWEGKWISDHHPVYALFDFDKVYIPSPASMEVSGGHESYNPVDMFDTNTLTGTHEDYKPVDIY